MKNIILFLFLFLFAVSTQAQKPDFPKGWLTQKDNIKPEMYRFRGKTFTLKTDPYLNYGYQYTTVCKIKWVNDSTFTLTPKRTYRKDNNRENTRRKRATEGWVFEINRHPYWSFAQGDGASFILRSMPDAEGKQVGQGLTVKLVPMD